MDGVVTDASRQPPHAPPPPAGLGGAGEPTGAPVLGDSARAAERAPGAGRRGARESWHRYPAVKAAALFAAVAGIGIAEVFLFGLPAWCAYLSAAIGALVGLDQLQLARRSRAVPAAPVAPAHGPDARRVLGYTDLPPADDGRALVADTSAVRAWCAEGGAVLVEMVHDVAGQGEREALAAALDRIASGEVGALVVPRLDCLAPAAPGACRRCCAGSPRPTGRSSRSIWISTPPRTPAARRRTPWSPWPPEQRSLRRGDRSAPATRVPPSASARCTPPAPRRPTLESRVRMPGALHGRTAR